MPFKKMQIHKIKSLAKGENKTYEFDIRENIFALKYNLEHDSLEVKLYVNNENMNIFSY